MPEKANQEINIIVAMSRSRAIGVANRLPWHIPEDMARFRSLTVGHTVIMGRRTFESLPHGALPGRRNIVVSTTRTTIEGCEVVSSPAEALALCKGKVFVMGGAQLYAAMLPVTMRIYLTLVEEDPQEADTYFPALDKQIWEQTKKEKHEGFSFIEYVRKDELTR